MKAGIGQAGGNRLWYQSAATCFEEALPLGNGRLGAMIYGRPWRKEDYFSERIPLNEETIWYGGPSVRENPDAQKTLPEVRQLLREGRLTEAEYLADHGMTAAPRNGTPYQALGELVFTSCGEHGAVEEYLRELDLETATVRVRYRFRATLFESESFASASGNVLVFRFRCQGKEKLNFHAYLRRRPFDGEAFRDDGGVVAMSGQAGPDGVRFVAAMAAVGGCHVSGQSLCFEETEEAILLVAAGSDFRGGDPRQDCLGVLQAARETGFTRLREEHVADYRRLYGRVSVWMGGHGDLPTDQRLARLREGESDPGMYALQFQFARYLTISASRSGGLPMTLQGLWCESMTPIWNCNYTINVNLQMCYWPTEAAALEECCEPLWAFLRRMVERGRRTAREMYGCGGFVAHHTSDIWADTAPTGGVYAAALWPFGGAWLALHAWEHFRFGGNREFLRSTAYPMLREAALFFCDFLVLNEHGERVAAPSVSPENWYVRSDGTKTKMCAGASMDGQILRELFAATVQSAEILGVDADYCREWNRLRDELPPPRIGRHGAMQEWLRDYEEFDPGHRHVSHLFCLHPGSQVSPLTEPELAAAARETLQRRLAHTTDRTGWSQAWMANHFARLLDPESAVACLNRVLAQFTYDSLLTSCPPLNLDANFGFASAFLEMLVQSHRGEIHLLPALPSGWPDGEISGLRARGGFVIGLKWAAGRLVVATISSRQGGKCFVRCGTPIQPCSALADDNNAVVGFRYRLTVPVGEPVVLRSGD